MAKNEKDYKRIKVDGIWVREHRYLMEKALGRKLKKEEQIHHIDGNPKNNDFNNLQLVSPSEHRRLHIGEPHYSNRKYIFVTQLPEEKKEGDSVCLMPSRRAYKVYKCLVCERLFWARTDYKKDRTCGASCWFELDRRKNGRAKNSRYNYVCRP